MLALPQDHVRQVLGNARFLLARRRDAEMLDEAIATASPEANHAMAVWDPQGKGYCAETVAYDLANLATNAIHRIRVHSTRNNPVNFAFEIEVGDYVFRMRGAQLHRGGDILVKVVGRVRSAPLDAARLHNMRVLAVDDNAINRHILAEILSRWGMKPTLATGAEEALILMHKAQTAGKPFPLVIVDAQMPVVDGFPLIERIRLDPLLAGAIIMMLTSCGQPGDAERCLELGASAYLTKPINESDLRKATLQVLGKGESAERPPQLVTRHSLWVGHKKLRVLVAEDNAVNQLLTKRLVENQGHTVVLIASGREALEALKKGAIDLVLMDVQMPDMDGLEATAIIRQRERHTGAHLPIIAMTANAMQGDMELCLEAGMDAYVSKPVNLNELFTAIERVMLPRQPE